MPIHKFAKDWFNGEEYWTAIGIRVDEIDRINTKRKENRLIYPLAELSMQPMTKQKINFWWKQQDFRLELKGYQGNCVTCWKKGDKKLYTIANENPSAFDFMDKMEKKYPRVGSEFLKDETCVDRVFFRGNRTAQDILRESKNFTDEIRNDAIDFNIQTDLFENESCEVFSTCGIDN